MASLSALLFNLVGSLCAFCLSMVAFGFAIKNRSTFIASRCEARPPSVIYNPADSKDFSQERGNPIFGWIPWVMGLSYETMLRGVPGTGTRDGGLSGTLLNVNLDGIVLLRFHQLGLRVCCLGCLLYIVVVLPIYATAQCSHIGGDYGTLNCEGENFNTTEYSYQRLTLANVPSLEFVTPDSARHVIANFFRPIHAGTLVRLYVVVFVTWIVTFYVLRELNVEWGDVLAMRRVYYLEADHWKDRKEELEHTLLRAERQKFEGNRDTKQEEAYLSERKPWIPHPEQRDTIPNIELYSILVGGLPSLPTEAVDKEDTEAKFTRKQSIDWQLAVTSAFFDHCVPNQPGFSSSIAAVTILPSATHLTEAWTQWYRVAGKLRRLRFIRKEINKRKACKKAASDLAVDLEAGRNGTEMESARRVSDPECTNKKSLNVYAKTDEKDEYYQEVLGSSDDLQVESRLLYALNYGPEQTAAYAREFAAGAANMAPYGWNEKRVLNATLHELLFLEREAIEAVHEANMALREAQERIAETADEEEDINGGDTLSNSPCSNEDAAFARQRRLESKEKYFSRKTSFSEILSSAENSLPNSTDDEQSFGDCSLSSDESFEEPLEKGKATNLRKRLSRNNSFGSSISNSIGSAVEKVSRLARSQSAVSSDSGSNRKPKATLESANLPGNLGLEAGLWMEQKALSRRDGSKHDHRRSCSRGEKSVLGNSIHGLHRTNAQLASGRRPRTSSRDETLPATHTITKPLRRTFSSDDIDLLEELEEHETNSIHLTENSQLVKDDESIWTRLAKDKDRKSMLRLRLLDIQQEQNNMKMCSHHSDGEKKAMDSDLKPKALENSQDTENGESLHGAGKLSKNDLTPAMKIQQQHHAVSRNSHTLQCLKEDRTDDDASIGMDLLNAKPATLLNSHIAAIGEESHRSLSYRDVEDNLKVAFEFENNVGLRHRDISAQNHGEKFEDNKWIRVKAVVQELQGDGSGTNEKDHTIFDGNWSIPSFEQFFRSIRRTMLAPFSSCQLKMKTPTIVDDLVRDTSYAVVTFTSRQAAVAARHCLADSRGHNRWVTIGEIPTPPLADAPVFNASLRGCVRPVTLSISDKQKTVRHILTLAILAAIYIFYTIPLTLAQAFVSPENLVKIFPDIEQIQEDSVLLSNILSGLVPALVWTGFIAACPPLFRTISNFGSNATSLVTAENSALRYFWWFMLLSAFTGTSFSSAVVNGFNEGFNLGSELQKVFERTAATIPKQVSATWLNWMIVRVFVVLPTQYLLQLNTFVFSGLGLKSCARSARGGGAGGPVPYRLYVDGGVVMLCLFALAPASPLISAASLTYFLLCIPMLRWTLIFLYRPKFDVGGGRFPFMFDMCISGLIAGQVFLIAMMTLKRAAGPALAAFCPIIPTIWFRYFVRRRFLRAFNDAALLQTSLLDGWDTNEETSEEKREEYRRFLVDCHKAAYVPVCIAGEGSTQITSEPAVVVPDEFDHDDEDIVGQALPSKMDYQLHGGEASEHTDWQTSLRFDANAQNMPMMRRTRAHEAFVEPNSPLRRNSSIQIAKHIPKNAEQGSFLMPPVAETRKSDLSLQQLPLSPIL